MRKWKILLIMIVFLVLIQTTLSCKQRYDIGENVIIIDTIVSWGVGADCNLTTYNGSYELINTSWMDINGSVYSKNLTKLSRGTYTSAIECNLSNNVYLGECKFKVGEEVKMWDVAIGIILIGIISIFIYLTFKSRDAFENPMLAKSFMMFFFFISIGLIALLLQVSSLIVTDMGAPAGVITLMNTSYKAILWTLITFLFFGFILGFYYLMNYMKMSSGLFRRFDDERGKD